MNPDALHSYPSVYNLGHRALTNLFDGPVVVEEKVDGSQFSFGVFNGELRCRSKGQQLYLDAPEKMFVPAIESVRELAPMLRDGWVYRAEFLGKPKHNVLAYERTPEKYLIIFDINDGLESYLSHEEKAREAYRIGLECVPHLPVDGPVSTASLETWLHTKSILGGQNIEGVVIKNYAQFGPDKKALMGKHVSEAFKEVHKGEWRNANPTSGDVLQSLIVKYRTPARWDKAVQHLREAGQIDDSPRDIGLLMKEVGQDILKECEEDIKEALWKYAWPKIQRGVTGGLPEWYKQELARRQFGETD